jgi:hypothetical protein
MVGIVLAGKNNWIRAVANSLRLPSKKRAVSPMPLPESYNSALKSENRLRTADKRLSALITETFGDAAEKYPRRFFTPSLWD